MFTPAVPSREICKACYEIIRVGFTVPDEVWNIAVPERLRDSTLCLTCFTRLADEHLLAWDEGIQFWPVALATHLGKKRRVMHEKASAKVDSEAR